MLTLKQIKFCELYVGGNNATDSYKIAYNSSNLGTCKVNSSKMLNNQHIKDKIKELQDFNKRITERAEQKNKDKEIEYKIATVLERKYLLTKIMLEKDINGIQTVIGDKIKAIAELNKMDGSYAPIQTQTDLTLNGNGDLPIDKWLKDAESK